jgi:Cu-Zn family superoxide dismutase
MNKLVLAFLVLSPLAAVAAPATTVTVKMTNAAGKSVGTATLTDTGSGVKIDLDLTGLPPGDHAIHIHQTAKCDAPDFKTAGGHFNPDNKKHGMQSKDGPHAGDMPNFTADAKGNAKTSITDANVNLKATDPHSAFTGGGTALVIHEKADDMKTDPAGNAGNRIACGVIAPAK